MQATASLLEEGTTRTTLTNPLKKSIYNDSKGYTLQQAYEVSGGFGRFQWATTVILTFGFMTSYFLSYSLPLLELQPKYICTDVNGKDYSCKNNEFCGTNIPYRIDYSDDASL